MRQFLWGASALASWVAGLYFAKFWRMSQDRLFCYFSIAFWALAAHWTALAVVNPAEESRHYLYLPRLLAFVVILIAIIDKNRRGPGS